jgi:hypothetical protein
VDECKDILLHCNILYSQLSFTTNMKKNPTSYQCFSIWWKIARFRSSILISWRMEKLSYILLISIARKLVLLDSLEPKYSLCQRLVLLHLTRFLVQYHRLKVFNASFEQLFRYNSSWKNLVSLENQLTKNLCHHHFILAKSQKKHCPFYPTRLHPKATTDTRVTKDASQPRLTESITKDSKADYMLTVATTVKCCNCYGLVPQLLSPAQYSVMCKQPFNSTWSTPVLLFT